MNNMSTKSDWSKLADIDATNILKVPSFVRLFVTHRVLNNADCNTSDAIHILVSKSTFGKALHTITEQILSQLMQHGIKDYLNKYYKEKDQAHTIELIFNQIILKQLTNNYQNVTTYTCPTITIAQNNNKNTNYNPNKTNYKNLLFNTEDIMCLIFQYLIPFNDLSNCSLVCSQWFYHSFNPKSIYYLSLSTLATATAICDENSENNVTRAWQRLYNVKSIEFEFRKASKLLLNKLSMLRNVEMIEDVNFGTVDHVPPLQAVLRNCKDKIKKFHVQLECDHDEQYKLSPLILNNAREILTDHVYFPIFWSNKLEKLTFLWVQDVGTRWCNEIINDCDCSGIKNLTIHNLTFNDSMNVKNNPTNTNVLLKKLGEKFVQNGRLQNLTISFYETVDLCVLLLWKYLQSTVERNNGYMELQIPRNLSNDDYKNLISTIEDTKPCINKIDVSIGKSWKEQKQWIKKIITKCGAKGNNSLEWIQIAANRGEMETYKETLESFELEFVSKSGIISVYDWGTDVNKNRFDQIIELLPWIISFGIKQEIGFVSNMTMDCTVEENITAKFDTLFQVIFSILIEKRMAIHINWTFEGLAENDAAKCDQVFGSYFGGDKMKQEYKIPKCSMNIKKYMTSRKKPVATFSQEDARDKIARYFRVKNVALDL